MAEVRNPRDDPASQLSGEGGVKEIDAIIAGYPTVIDGIEAVKAYLHQISPLREQAIDHVRWRPIGEVIENDYNPNSVARAEMKLLAHSIRHDGYTQPIVTIRDEGRQRFCIVDGFHRYFVAKTNPDILERNKGMVPIVVIDKDVNDRMAATVRHNRARGKHSMTGMGQMIFTMLENGWTDEAICNELGMEAEEIARLKHITGFSKLFENVEYRKSWITRKQALMLAKRRAEGLPCPP